MYKNDITHKKIDIDFFGKQERTECGVKPIISMISKIFKIYKMRYVRNFCKVKIITTFGTKYSRLEQVKFVEDSL